MVTTATSDGSGGGNEQTKTVRINGLGTEPGPYTNYRVYGSGGVDPSQSVDEEDNRVDANAIEGVASTGWDEYLVTGEMAVENLGNDDPETPTVEIEVVVDGQPASAIASGNTYGNMPSKYGGGLWSLIPGLLPGIGPLNSSQTTAVAIIAALAIAGTVMG